MIKFKIQTWSLMEYHGGAILHAASSLLQQFDDVQNRLFSALQSDASTAFLEYNFAPPTLRRDIGLLGLIHKRVLGLAHPLFEELLPWSPHPAHVGPDRQLNDFASECKFRRMLLQRSLFGLVGIYNLLPQYVVNCETVSLFQKELTRIARKSCEDGSDSWTNMFACRVQICI